MLNDNTPLESYTIDGKVIWVKREDMYGSYPAPPLAKLRGAKVLLEKLNNRGINRVGVFDTRVSKAGQGIAFLCKELGMECVIGFTKKKGEPIAESKIIARDVLGAELRPLTGTRTSIAYYQLRNQMREEGAYTLPLGLVCKETVEEVQRVALNVLRKLDGLEMIVVVAGSGTIATGIILATQARMIVSSIPRVVCVSCGMNKGKFTHMKELAYPNQLWNYQIVDGGYDYYTALDTSSCPFPTSPYYDMKAWHYMMEHFQYFKGGKTLFWNIGV